MCGNFFGFYSCLFFLFFSSLFLHANISSKSIQDYEQQPWFSYMTPASQTLIQNLCKAIFEINAKTEIPLIDLQACEYEVYLPKFKQFAFDIKKLVYQVNAIYIQQENVYKDFLLKPIVKELKTLKEFDSTEYNSLTGFERFSLLNKAYDAVLRRRPELVKASLELMLKQPSEKRFIESIRSFNPRSDQLKRLYTSTDPLTKKLAQKIFVDWGDYYVLNVYLQNALKAANMFSAPLEILKDISSRFHSLIAYRSCHKLCTPLTLWMPYDIALKKLLFPQQATKELFKRAALTIFSMPLFKTTYGRENLVTPFDIIFFGSSLPKIFPSRDNGLFSIEHVNSAESDRNHDALHLYRAEEALKTIMHEMYHRLDLEKVLEIDSINACIQRWADKNLAFDTDVLLTESLVEAVAALINVCATAAEISHTTKEDFMAILGQMWALEKIFYLYQSAKILYISHFDSIEEFLHPAETKKRVYQTTAAVEYHILKAAFLHNVEKFLTTLLVPSSDEKTQLPYELHDIYFSERLQELILEAFKDTRFTNIINAFLASFEEQSQMTPLFKTGRMTLIEKDIGLHVQAL